MQLAAVTFIDSLGKALLALMYRQGAKLVPTGCLMKVIVEEIEAELVKGEMIMNLKTKKAAHSQKKNRPTEAIQSDGSPVTASLPAHEEIEHRATKSIWRKGLLRGTSWIIGSKPSAICALRATRR